MSGHFTAWERSIMRRTSQHCNSQTTNMILNLYCLLHALRNMLPFFLFFVLFVSLSQQLKLEIKCYIGSMAAQFLSEPVLGRVLPVFSEPTFLTDQWTHWPAERENSLFFFVHRNMIRQITKSLGRTLQVDFLKQITQFSSIFGLGENDQISWFQCSHNISMK